MKPTWLVTGGAGFIGANFVRMAHARTDASLIVLDALTYAGDLARLDELVGDPRISIVHGDVCDRPLLERLFAAHDVSVVAHFAAETHVDRSIVGPAPFIRTNIQGTAALLEATQAAWKDQAERRRFLHVSTDEVFGSLGPDEAPFTEQSPVRPNSPYAASKAASDLLVRSWSHTFGLPVLVSNCSNNYGPWQFPEKLIPLMISNAIEERPLPIYGDGLQVRDWLHVEDHCEGLLRLLTHGRPGETYVFGGRCERTNRAIVGAICDAVDQATGRATGTSRRLMTTVKDRLGHDRRYAISPDRAARELGWTPSRLIEDDIPSLVKWYLERQAWVDRVRSGQYREEGKEHLVPLERLGS